VESRAKAPASLLISVLTADDVLIIGAYSVVVFIAGALEKRRNKEGTYIRISHKTKLHSASHCPGCFKSHVMCPCDKVLVV
jgi:hypothetical protein